MPAISPFKDIENKNDAYMGNDSMKKNCESLRDDAIKIINFKKKKMKLLTICNLKCRTPKEITTIFHNGSNSDYHYIIRELAEEFRRQFTCLGENTAKYI